MHFDRQPSAPHERLIRGLVRLPLRGGVPDFRLYYLVLTLET